MSSNLFRLFHFHLLFTTVIVISIIVNHPHDRLTAEDGGLIIQVLINTDHQPTMYRIRIRIRFRSRRFDDKLNFTWTTYRHGIKPTDDVPWFKIERLDVCRVETLDATVGRLCFFAAHHETYYPSLG